VFILTRVHNYNVFKSLHSFAITCILRPLTEACPYKPHIQKPFVIAPVVIDIYIVSCFINWIVHANSSELISFSEGWGASRLRRRSIFPYTFSLLILYVMQLIFPEGWAASTRQWYSRRRRYICSNFCFNDLTCSCILSVLSSFSGPAWLGSAAIVLHKKTRFVETIYCLLSHSPSIRFIYLQAE